MLSDLDTKVLDQKRVSDIINKVGPVVEDIFKSLKYDLGGRLPAELSYGIVAGYLKGKGFTWEESFMGMDKFIRVMEKLAPTGPKTQATFTIKGKTDGNVECNLEK